MSNRSYNPSAPAGSEGSNIITPVYERGENIGVKYRGRFYTTKQFNEEVLRRSATKENTQSKRNDELKALSLIPFERLDKPQEYANAGETMPIVFCRRVNNAGGVWISPPLLDSSSDNFAQTFVYLISHGQTSIPINTQNYFFGKQCLADTGVASGITFNIAHTNDPAVCPLAGYSITCDHTNFNFLADPVSTTVGEYTQIRTVNKYATGVTIRVKPLYPSGSASPTVMTRYTLTVFRTDNATGTTTTVGTLTTSTTGTIGSISDTTSAGNYTYTIENTAVAATGTIAPETILVEFRQSNTFPTSYDRTSSYTNIQLLGAEANLYDITRTFSPPSELKQLHIFMENGLYVDRWRFNTNSISTGVLTGTTGSSDKFADLVYYWFRNSGKYPNTNFTYFPATSCALCALFQEHYNITYNAYFASNTSFLAYAQSVAPMMLCSMYNLYGAYAMKPLLPLKDNGEIQDGALSVSEAFDDTETLPDTITNSIITGSYYKEYKKGEELLPINVVVTWRGQDNYNLETSQTTVVRYSDYPADAPEETYDMTEFCTNADHATIFAKYILATRRYSRHVITFQTARNVESSSFLDPLDVITVSLTLTNSAGDSRTETEYYLVDSLDFNQTGVVTITASQFPVDGSGASIISNSILSGSFEVTT